MRVLYTDEACLEVVGEAKRFLAGVILCRQAAGVVQLRDELVYGDFTFIATASAVAEDKVIIIGESGIGGFLCHPQTTDYPGGKSSADDTPLPHVSDYPLLDDDLGTFHVFTDGSEWLADREGENYGNIDWKGMSTTGEGEASDAPILTWKGPPSRHFPLDPKKYLPGLTVLDEEVEENGLPVNYYTPFGPNVYEGGEVLATLPPMGATVPKVLGACYRDGILTVMVGANYRGLSNPAGTTGGFFYELWQKGSDWQRLGFRTSSRQTVPWFFSQSGAKGVCVQDGVIYRVTLDPQKLTAVFTSDTACSGTQTVTKSVKNTSSGSFPTSYWNNIDTAAVGVGPWTKTTDSKGTFTVTRRQTCTEAVDYVGEVEVSLPSTLTTDNLTTIDNYSSETASALDIIPFDAPSAVSVGTTATEPISGDVTFTGSGGCGPYSFSVSGIGSIISSTGTSCVVRITCTPGARGEVVVTATDTRGMTGSVTRRAGASGHYVLVQTQGIGRMSNCSPCGATNVSYVTVNTGATQEYQTWGATTAGHLCTKYDCPSYIYDVHLVPADTSTPYLIGNQVSEWQCI